MGFFLFSTYLRPSYRRPICCFHHSCNNLQRIGMIGPSSNLAEICDAFGQLLSWAQHIFWKLSLFVYVGLSVTGTATTHTLVFYAIPNAHAENWTYHILSQYICSNKTGYIMLRALPFFFKHGSLLLLYTSNHCILFLDRATFLHSRVRLEHYILIWLILITFLEM